MFYKRRRNTWDDNHTKDRGIGIYTESNVNVLEFLYNKNLEVGLGSDSLYGNRDIEKKLDR